MAHGRDDAASHVMLGALMMLLGVVLTLERLGMIEPVHVRQFWPMLPIAGGASMLLQRRDANGRFWGLFWMLLGGCMLANSLGVARVSLFGVAGPLLLILLGLAVMSRTFSHDPPPLANEPPGTPLADPAAPAAAPMVPPPLPGTAGGVGGDASTTADTAAADRVRMFAFMANTTRTSTGRWFGGGEMGAFLGQGRLDLRQATIPAGGTAVVDVFALMAGHEIFVPPGWEVVADTTLMLAKVQDARLPPIERRPADAPRLQLRGFVMIGEIVIRN